MTRYHVIRPGDRQISLRHALGLLAQAILLVVGGVIVILALSLENVR